jgi:pimeloyl-ACP methyl ester carboxylesterase
MHRALVEFLSRPQAPPPAILLAATAEELLRELPKAMPWRKTPPTRLKGQVDVAKSFYLYHLPPDYTPDRPWPMVFSLHGNPPGHVHRVHRDYWSDDAAKAGYVLVSPALEGGRWNRAGEALVIQSLRDAVSRFHIDPKRIYIDGYSSGGSGAWWFSARFADLFAGVIIRCGIRRISDRELSQLRDKAIFLIHAAQDLKCPVEQARQAAATMARKKIPHRYVEFPRGHDFYPSANQEVLRYVSGYSNRFAGELSMKTSFRTTPRIVGVISATGRDHDVTLSWKDNVATVSMDAEKDIRTLDVFFREDLTDYSKPVILQFNEARYEVQPARSASAFLAAWRLHPFFDSLNPTQLFTGGVRIIEEGKRLDIPKSL